MLANLKWADVIDLKIVPDAKSPNQFGIELIFKTPQAAQAFNSNLKNNTVIVNQAMLTMDADVAQKLFDRYNIGTHGITNPYPMFKALVHDHLQSSGSKKERFPCDDDNDNVKKASSTISKAISQSVLNTQARVSCQK